MRRSHYWLVVQLWVLLSASRVQAQRVKRGRLVEVTASDFAFTMPDTLAAGTHRWTFANKGSVRHELILVKLAPGVDPRVAVDSLHALGLRGFFPGSPSLGVAEAALFAAPDQKADAEVVTRARPGDVFLVFCQLRDAEGKPKHDQLGMFKVIRTR